MNSPDVKLASCDYLQCRIIVRKGDITDQPVDAIVNPANSELKNAGGAANAISKGAGGQFDREWDDYILKYNTLEEGKAMVTGAGDLPCKYVFNTVGPRCIKHQEDVSDESKVLKSCVKSVLRLMIEKDCKSLCLLAISTGIFHFPLNKCIDIYAETIRKFIENHQTEMKGKEIILCNFDDKTCNAMMKGKSTLISY